MNTNAPSRPLPSADQLAAIAGSADLGQALHHVGVLANASVSLLDRFPFEALERLQLAEESSATVLDAAANDALSDVQASQSALLRALAEFPSREPASDDEFAILLRNLATTRRLLEREARQVAHLREKSATIGKSWVYLNLLRAEVDRIHGLTQSISMTLAGAVDADDNEPRLDDALAVRIEAVIFRDTLESVEQEMARSAVESWAPFLEQIVESLDRILYSPTMTWLRDADRSVLAEVREHLDAQGARWQPSEAETEAAMRMLQSLHRAAQSTLRVNELPSVIKHDLKQLKLLMTDLAHGVTEASSLFHYLHPLVGRDAKLDALAQVGLNRSANLDTQALAAAARRVFDTLEAREA